MRRKIKLFDPVITGEEEDYLKNILQNGFWASGAGTGFVHEFEKKFQEYVGSKACVCVNSGTAALHLALSTSEIKNKEVILPSLSFVSTAHAVLYNGGKPVFVDIDPTTLCIDPCQIEKKMTSNTKVILPIHFGGMPANITFLKKLVEKSQVVLVEDAAHACGAEFRGKKIGSHGQMVCFSFHPVKNLAMPSGGLISINKPNFRQLKKILNSRRWCGILDRKDSFYNVKEIGWNFYMNEFSAGIGLAQLKKLDTLNNKRKDIAKKYYNKINLDAKMPFVKDCSYHFYWITVKNRTEFRKKMQDKGIETGIHYTPIHQFSLYKKEDLKLPITEEIGKSIVSIPTHPNLSESDVDFIIDTINEIA